MRLLATLLAALLWSLPAAAEIYRWVDAQGREHFTHDLSKVPPGQRGAARGAAEAGDESAPSPVQPFTRDRPRTPAAPARANDATLYADAPRARITVAGCIRATILLANMSGTGWRWSERESGPQQQRA